MEEELLHLNQNLSSQTFGPGTAADMEAGVDAARKIPDPIRLQRRGDIAHFVQEQRTLIRHFKAPDLLRNRTGKGFRQQHPSHAGLSRKSGQ